MYIYRIKYSLIIDMNIYKIKYSLVFEVVNFVYDMFRDIFYAWKTCG
jgi:hypothetical protein